MYAVVPACVRSVNIARIQAVTVYVSELRSVPVEGSRPHDIRLLLNLQAKSTLGTRPTTPRGAPMRVSGLTPVAVALEAGQERFVVNLASVCEVSKLKELFKYPSPGAPVGSVAATEYTPGRRAEAMRWPDPGENAAEKTTIQEADTEAKGAAKLWLKAM